MRGKTEVSFRNGGMPQIKMVAVTQQAFLLAPLLILKVKIYHPCRRSSALSFTGGITPIEEPSQKWFSWRKHVFLADGLASQQGLQTSLGTFSLWLVRR